MFDYQQEGDVAVLKIDDGKANAVSFDFIAQMNENLDRAEKEAKAVVFTGRPGRFSAGFDLSVMQGGGFEEMAKLVLQGAGMMLRLFTFPLPVVAASSGHSIAAGGFMLLSADTRIGTAGDFKIGLNETAIGMTLPVFGFQLAKARLAPTHFTPAVIQAKMYDPESAVEAGFLDQVVAADDLLPTAIETAATLGAFPADAYLGNKLGMRSQFIEAMKESQAKNIP